MGRIDSKLVIQAISKYLMGIVLVGILLFLPAGTFAYWNAWVMMAALFLPMLIAGVIMLAYLPIINVRMVNEEKVLSKGLEGYEEYKRQVRYKVIPFIW